LHVRPHCVVVASSASACDVGVLQGLGVKPESVNKDLLLYKSILSKMTAAKELMREFLEREKRKQAEREAGKAASATAEAAPNTEDGAKVPESVKASS
jgi:Thylakoid formation protein